MSVALSRLSPSSRRLMLCSWNSCPPLLESSNFIRIQRADACIGQLSPLLSTECIGHNPNLAATWPLNRYVMCSCCSLGIAKHSAEEPYSSHKWSVEHWRTQYDSCRDVDNWSIHYQVRASASSMVCSSFRFNIYAKTELPSLFVFLHQWTSQNETKKSVKMAFTPIVMTSIICRRKVSGYYNSRMFWPRIAKLYRDIHINSTFSRTWYDVTSYFWLVVIARKKRRKWCRSQPLLT